MKSGLILAAVLLAACGGGSTVGPPGPPPPPGPTPPPPPVPPGAISVTLDPNTRYQTIDGWAVYPRYWEDDKSGNRFDASFEPFVPAASGTLVNQVGINAIRFEVWSGMENPTDRWTPFYSGAMTYTEWANHRYEKINDNADPQSANLAGFRFEMFDYRWERMALPIVQALAARGETPRITLCYVDFKGGTGVLQGTLSHADNPAEYAELITLYFQRLKNKYGVTPDAFEVILEPENTQSWRGTQIGRGLVAVSDRLHANGFDPEIIAPSNASTSNAISYFDAMLPVAGVSSRLASFAYHRYGESTADVQAIYNRARTNGLKTAMNEKVGAGLDVLLEDLTVGNVSTWQQWAVASSTQDQDNGGYYLRINPASSPSSPQISMGKFSDLLSQVFLYVRRGAVRIASSSDNADKRTVAFINANGRWAAVVRGKTSGGTLYFKGLPAGQYGIRMVTDAGVRTDLPQASVNGNGVLITQMSGSGALTIYRLP